jgi:hypothetical protein
MQEVLNPNTEISKISASQLADALFDECVEKRFILPRQFG